MSINEMIKISLALIGTLIITTTQGAGEEPHIVPGTTVRVDTTQLEIKEILRLFENYLNSRPDSLYDNPNWSEKDKSRHRDFYSARAWIYSSKDILYAFPPRILSVEKEGEFYVIRILYYQEGLEKLHSEGFYSDSNPWALQRLYAAKEDGEWRLFDPLYIITSQWPSRQIGKINYIYSPKHNFNPELAQKQADFIDSIGQTFDLPQINSFEFFITDHQDELARILGLDYTLGPSVGRSITANAQVFTALGTEWYPHEIVHILLREFRSSYLLNEGIATWLGGSVGIPFDSLVKDLASYLKTNDTLTFQNMLDSPFQAGGTKYFYTAGAVICKTIFEKGGTKALKEFLKAGSSPDKLYGALQKHLGWKKEQVTEFWKKKTSEYAK